MVTGEDIVKYARTWRGTKWKHLGRDEKGIDCVGLLVRVAEHFGLPHADLTTYTRYASPEFRRHIWKYSIPQRPRVPINGAVGIFNDTIMPCHVGIFAVDCHGKVSVIHSAAYPSRRVVEQDYDAPYVSLKDRLVDIRLYKEVTYG